MEFLKSMINNHNVKQGIPAKKTKDLSIQFSAKEYIL